MCLPRREALAVHEVAQCAVLVVAMDTNTTGRGVQIDRFIAAETAAG